MPCIFSMVPISRCPEERVEGAIIKIGSNIPQIIIMDFNNRLVIVLGLIVSSWGEDWLLAVCLHQLFLLRGRGQGYIERLVIYIAEAGQMEGLSIDRLGAP